VHSHSAWSRIEWVDEVGSTNDAVRSWLREGTQPLCLLVADRQTAGRGREGRTWTAPNGAGLLCSIGFTPGRMPAGEEWKLAAIVSLAMAKAAEQVAGLQERTIRLKWPNDLVAVDASGAVRKLAGVLGETESAGTSDARAVIGIGVNADWSRADFPADLADSMTSLRELAPDDRPIDREALLETFMARIEPLQRDLLSDGTFPADAWRGRQLTNGNIVRLDWPDGTIETVRAVDVDPETGALVVSPLDAGEPRRHIIVGEIRHLRVGAVAAGGV
jgi:BirA family biotin operon repressor/biotin-[acetyl-CoA-carboxylase] ligase